MTADSKPESPSSDCRLFVLSMSLFEQKEVAGHAAMCSVRLPGENTGLIHQMGSSLGKQWH